MEKNLSGPETPIDYNALVEDRYRVNGFMHHNYIELDHAERDLAVFRLTIRPESRNPFEQLHGGAIYTMADNAAGAAAFSADGRPYVTQSTTFHFIRNVASGTVYATGRVIHRGRSTCLTRVEITDETGRLLATGDFSFFAVDMDLMNSKRPADSVYSGGKLPESK